jgi:hypothetical protein
MLVEEASRVVEAACPVEAMACLVEEVGMVVCSSLSSMMAAASRGAFVTSTFRRAEDD